MAVAFRAGPWRRGTGGRKLAGTRGCIACVGARGLRRRRGIKFCWEGWRLRMAASPPVAGNPKSEFRNPKKFAAALRQVWIADSGRGIVTVTNGRHETE